MTSVRSDQLPGPAPSWRSARTAAAAGVCRRGFQGRARGGLPLILGLGLSLALASVLRAETFEAGGLTFSDELGGFRLISVSGQGSPADPIVLVEEITGLGPAVLTVRRGVSGPAPPSSGVLLRSLVKVVVNRSGWRWSGFELELRSADGKASGYSDGLSFDQIRMAAAAQRSDLFAQAHAEDEPFDRLRFDRGRVQPDERVRLAFNLTDVNRQPVFFLAQQPIVLMAEAGSLRRPRPPRDGRASVP